MNKVLKAPFPWFGGKSRVADLIWERLGDPVNYVEPFFGSGAVLLAREHWQGKTETINDKDGFVSNFWRAVKFDPEHVAYWASWPVSENDLHVRNYYLAKRREEFRERLEGDPEYFDPMIAGWWVWGLSCSIGGGFASFDGPWSSVEGRFIRLKPTSGRLGISRKLPHLGDAGRGVLKNKPVADWVQELSTRLARVRICCGDWSRCLGYSVTTKLGFTGVFLDPPYDTDGSDVYYYDSDSVFGDVLAWCLESGEDELFRIALCGYEKPEYSEKLESAGWDVVAWKASGGYGSQGSGKGRENCTRERIWFSPHCIKPIEQGLLF